MYAVIGAGPMGLATARVLQKHGLPFTGFELHSGVGGLWDIANPQSTVYESAHLISSKRMTEFAEFPMRPEVAPYPRHDELKRYFVEFAAHFGLTRHYEFSTQVLRVARAAEGGWNVTTACGGTERTRHFAGVLIATGTLHHPFQPALPGAFAGTVMHSAQYKSPEQLRGQRVLVVGCGNSGADIAVDAVRAAASVDLSVRRGYWFLPKFLKGKPIDTFGGLIRLPRPLKQRLDGLMVRMVVGKPSDYGLPDPEYRLYESHPVMNSLLLHHLAHGDITPRADVASVEGHGVTFADGRSADYDTILQATGYALHYPFIAREALNWPAAAAAPSLYLNVMHPTDDTLFLMGMVEASGLGWQGRYEQAELVALYLARLAERHPAALALQAEKRAKFGERVDGGFNYLKLDRMAYYVHKDSYLKLLRRHTRALRG
ncbi:NAD(P)-binding domain-containing protein [Pseudogemmatithrix spongiicola]|uniref:NAD(P)-binding domain-containing protein n=1 Tax=Pseudogemmatithrix spongiicola TaxID=3062599 RepID=A0AA49K1F9_9BACT|nr:NAD(P)-binding domain-containing protein [Gemmatimonadaceae bacterium 'strain 138']WKW15931.1 NAD(P)-binding domain-containing protein [Gemmatimonadaceae bacterium 'strain 318']